VSDPRPTFGHYVEYGLFLFIGALVRLVPKSMLHDLGIRIGRLIFPFLKSRQRVAVHNLRNAFPDLPLQECERLAARSFETVSAAFIELMAYPSLDADDIRRMIVLENPEVLVDLRRRNVGAVLVTAHFGSWELAAQAITLAAERKPHVIAKKQSNALVDRVVTGYRRKFGAVIVPMQAVREVLKVLQEGGLVVMAADQAASKESYPVEFFGRLVPTFGGPAVFALRTNSAIVVGLAVAQPDGTYRMRLEEVPADDLKEYSEANVHELTRRHVRLTEALIREHPEQWMWMHKRWKHVPDRPEVAGRT